MSTSNSTTRLPMEPSIQPGQPDTPDTPGAPEPSAPDETPFTEPKQYPIHPDIPVQPIHENGPTRC